MGYSATGRRSRDEVRVSDDDRERAADSLKRHFAAGRLTAEELEERLGHAWGAQVRADVHRLFRDLPRGAGLRPSRRRIERMQRAALRAHAAGYATLNSSLVGVWALTGEGAFWPAWSLVPGTALLAWHVAGSRKLSRRLRAGDPGARRLGTGS
jgi:Domain of unknown function (DUF1707)